MAEQVQAAAEHVNESLNQTATNLSRVVKTLQSTSKSVGQVALAVSTAGKAASSASSSAKKLKGQIRDLFSFDEINRLSSESSSGSSASSRRSSGSSKGSNANAAKEEVTWLQKLKTLLDELLEPMQKFWNMNGGNTLKALQNLKKAASELGAELKGALRWGYQNVLVPLGKWTLQSLAPAILNTLTGVIRILTAELKIFKPIAETIWERILKPLASWSAKMLVDSLKNAADAVSWVADRLEGLAALLNSGDILGEMRNFGASILTNIVSGLSQGIQGVKEAIGSLITNVFYDSANLSATEPIRVPVQLASSAGQLWEQFKTGWTTQNASVKIGNALTNTAGALWSFFKESWGESHVVKIGNSLKNAAGTLWSTFKAAWGDSHAVKIINTLQSAAATLWSSFKAAWGTRTVSIQNKLATSAATLWNNLKSGWANKTLSLTVTYSTNVSALKKAVYKALGLSGWPTLKFAARGGIVSSATLMGNTLVGEAGMEAIVPLENHTEWMDKVAQRLASQLNGGSGSSRQPVIVQVVLDGRVVGQTAVDYINHQARANGVHPLGAYL